MGWYRRWRDQRILMRYPIDDALWQSVLHQLPILDGLRPEESFRLRDRAILFLARKRLNPLPGVEWNDESKLRLAAQAELPLLHLPELDWYQGFHEVILYPGDFISPQKHRDASGSGVMHEFDDARSGETSYQGPVIMAWPGVLESGEWHGFNLIIHELSHKLDMLNGDANGMPPLHADMHPGEWTQIMQHAYDDLNARLDEALDEEPPIDDYAAENPAEFFAVTSEYFFTAPDLLHDAYPAVYRQLEMFYRQNPLQRLLELKRSHPLYRDGSHNAS